MALKQVFKVLIYTILQCIIANNPPYNRYIQDLSLARDQLSQTAVATET